MKKIVMFLMFCCGIIGNSWAVCELTESTDLTPSDEDLYPQDPNVSRMALICEKGKCEDGEMVYVGGTHYIGNMFNSAGFTTVNKGAYYKCKLGGNDRWLEAQPSDIRTTASYIAPTGERPMIEYDDNKGLFVYGTMATDGYYFTNIIYVEPDEKCGVKCTPEIYSENVYCGGRLYLCDNWHNDFKGFGNVEVCEYSDPLTRVADGKEVVGDAGVNHVVFGDRQLKDKDIISFYEVGFCTGCATGYYFSGDVSCYDNLEEAWCDWRRYKDSKNTYWHLDDYKCNCLDDGMEWSTEKHDCVKSGKGGKTGAGSTGSGKTGGSGSGKPGGKTGNKTGANTGKVNKTCAEMHPGNSEAIACCEFGKNGGAEWKDNKCNCFGENKKWEYSDNIKMGHCVDDIKTGKQPEKKPEVKNDKINCIIELGASVQCRNGTKFNKNTTMSLSAEQCNLYKSNVAKYLKEIAGMLCEKSGGVGDVITDAQLKAATDNINRFFEYAKSNISVWKNADGKFNTARLASDATAGVILGTVGGIVSAKIIKKKQVEKGFDALNCSVGGQKVADWGDEFTVGFGI